MNLFRFRKTDPGWISSAITALALAGSGALVIRTWDTSPVHFSVGWLSIATGSDPIQINLGFLFDNVSVFMCLVVLIIAFAVHLFSIDYMKGEYHYRRFFSLLGFFTFSMLGFVLSDNLLMMFIFWELLGFSSYVLIGFFFRKPSAARAARKTFMINRIADIGFLIALMILWSHFGTFDLDIIKQNVSNVITDPSLMTRGTSWLFFAGMGLFVAAIGKSAQFPLLVWLPDAMEGPIPVSALIHAATMVTAGVFMLTRTFALLTIPVLNIITITGTITAFMGAIAALSQYDLKKVLAYSTISQLGFMITGIGVGAKEPALFHLFTHAFFKAGLFLSAGMIIKTLNELVAGHYEGDIHIDPQDMRIMGGLRSRLPLVFLAFTMFSAALAGIPFFSGFLSKDTILNGTLAWARFQAIHGNLLGYLVPAMGFLTSFLTVLYIGRAVALTFFGEFRLPKLIPGWKGFPEKLKQRPAVASYPVLLLSVLSLAIIFSVNPFSPGYSWVLSHIKPGVQQAYSTASLNLSETLSLLAEKGHSLIAILSMGVAFGGVISVYYLFMARQKFTTRLKEQDTSMNFFQGLSYHNWYLDEFYRFVFIRPFNEIANAASWTDKKIIDRSIDMAGIVMVVAGHVIGWLDRILVDGLVKTAAWLVRQAGKAARSLQSGKIQHYYIWAITFLLLVIILWSL